MPLASKGADIHSEDLLILIGGLGVSATGKSFCSVPFVRAGVRARGLVVASWNSSPKVWTYLFPFPIRAGELSLFYPPHPQTFNPLELGFSAFAEQRTFEPCSFP